MSELTIEEMRLKVAEADRQALAEKQKQDEERLKPLNDLISSEELAKLKKDTQELLVIYASDDSVNHKLHALKLALNLF